MNKCTDIVLEEIETYGFNKLIFANELYHKLQSKSFDSISSAAYYKVLERLVKSGTIVRLTAGVYYKPKSTRFGIVPISDEEIASYYLDNNSGVEVGYKMYNKKGLTTQVGKRIEILSTAADEEHRSLKNVSVEKISMTLNSETVTAIETLEILQSYNKIEDLNLNAFVSQMRSFSENYSEAAINYVISNRKYKKSTIAFLKTILDRLNVQNNLSAHLSETSNYIIPSVEEFI